jgi:hypothetical protein
MIIPKSLEYAIERVIPWTGGTRKMHGPAVTGVLESVGSCSTAFQCFVCETLEGIDSMNCHSIT